MELLDGDRSPRNPIRNISRARQPTFGSRVTCSSGFFSLEPECEYPVVAAVTTIRTNRRNPASNLFGNTLAFGAINVGTAAEWTLIGTDYMSDFHERIGAHAAVISL
jgi:hypothetical protein